uniref:CN hydrolase domain-containing protein n=1 Tax=Mesocestoides corti TaxID=53468 RepID=A0A5K3FSZ5_MESCO
MQPPETHHRGNILTTSLVSRQLEVIWCLCLRQPTRYLPVRKWVVCESSFFSRKPTGLTINYRQASGNCIISSSSCIIDARGKLTSDGFLPDQNEELERRLFTCHTPAPSARIWDLLPLLSN